MRFFWRRHNRTFVWVLVAMFAVATFACVGSVVFASGMGNENAATAESSMVIEAAARAEGKIEASQKNIPTLKPVVVVGSVESSAVGKSVLDAAQLTEATNRSSSVNDALSILPSVQYSESVNNSFTAGEILPPNLSISGGSVFQNNFQIDGIGNNSLLDPERTSTISGLHVPEHPQLIHLNIDHLESVTVYDNIVPAKYGGFNGGVVDAETRRPDPAAFSGSVRYRTTRSDWTRFHVADTPEYSYYGSDYEQFVNSDSALMQPEFTKHETAVLLNFPVSNDAAVIASYSILTSDIPLQYFGDKKSQSRKSENFFIKYGHQLSSSDYLALSAIYAPYSGDYFRSSGWNDLLYDAAGDPILDEDGDPVKRSYPMQVKGSDYTVESDALQLLADFSHEGSLVDSDIKLAYQVNKNARHAPQHFYRWLSAIDIAQTIPSSKDWGYPFGWNYSDEGHLGDIVNRQETWQVKADLQMKKKTIAGIDHLLAAGVDYQYVTGKYHRPETSYEYTGPKLDPDVVCLPGDAACVDGEQYLSRRSIYRAAKATIRLQTIGVYVDDQMTYKRLGLRLGVRYETDDYMKNHNVAPRLSTTYDIFGKGETVLLGGWSRYYDKTLLGYSLREGFSPYGLFQTRSAYGNWGAVNSGQYYNYSELDTPYVDEAVVGVQQTLFGGLLDIRYVQRRYDNQFSYSRSKYADDLYHQYLNNNGRKKYQSVRAVWEKIWAKRSINVNVVWEESEANLADYSNRIDDDSVYDQILYNGQLMYKYEVPARDFNRPWVANLKFSTELPYGFKFTNITKYRSGYRAFGRTTTDPSYIIIDGNYILIYEKVKRPSATLFDWRLEWGSPEFLGGHNIVVSMDIFNVFDKKTTIEDGDTDSDRSLEYELGRQFWVGAEYKF